MPFLLEIFTGLIGAATLGIFAWAFSLNSKVAVLIQRDEDYKDLVNTRFDSVDHRLSRIESALNGAIKGK